MERVQFVQEVTNKMRKNLCDLFIGSGISAPSGLPTWSNFLSPYLKELGIQICDEDNLPLLSQYIVNRNSGNRNIISEAIYNTFGQNYPLNKYHTAISKLPVKTIWTTNYDCLLEKTFFDRDIRVVTSEDTLLHPHSIPDIEIIKLHGCAKNAAQGIVLTQADYDCFQFNKPKLSQRLREAIISKSILFLGYSYHDPNIQSIMIQAYHMMNEITNTHYILLSKPEIQDDESKQMFDQRELRFNLWISELNRIGIRELVVSRSEILSVLKDIDKKSHEAHIFVTGSHNPDPTTEEYSKLVGTVLAKIPEVTLNNGQSSGVGNMVLSSFMQYTFEHKQDMNKRIQIFPNPYAISPEYADNPTLIPNLKAVRAPLITSSTLVIAFPGNIGTVAEIEVARSKERLVLPILWDEAQYNSPAIEKILEDQDNMRSLKELIPDYCNILMNKRIPSEDNIVQAIQEIINGKTHLSAK